MNIDSTYILKANRQATRKIFRTGDRPITRTGWAKEIYQYIWQYELNIEFTMSIISNSIKNAN